MALALSLKALHSAEKTETVLEHFCFSVARHSDAVSQKLLQTRTYSFRHFSYAFTTQVLFSCFKAKLFYFRN